MNSAGSVEPWLSVAHTLLHTDNEVETIQTGDSNLAKANHSPENSIISKDKATLERINKVRLRNALIYAFTTLSVCVAISACFFNIMLYPTLILGGALAILNLFIEPKDHDRSRRYA